MKLSPADIRFMHDTISSEFRNKKSVNATIEDIASGKMRVNVLPTIRVVHKDSLYYAFDNRRLYVYRVLHLRGLLDEITVEEASMSSFQPRRFTTVSNGKTVEMRNGICLPHWKEDVEVDSTNDSLHKDDDEVSSGVKRKLQLETDVFLISKQPKKDNGSESFENASATNLQVMGTTTDIGLNFNRKKTNKMRKQTPLQVLKLLKEAKEKFATDEPEYYFENGFRKVRPYYYHSNAFSKDGSWLGKTIREICKKKSSVYPIEHYEKAIKTGELLCNLQKIDSLDTVLKPNDMLTHKVHRHESYILDSSISIIVDNSKYLVVNKPTSMPVYPSGRYHNNSLVHILKREFGYSQLYQCHTLHRLTSGIVVFAKTKSIASDIIAQVKENNVEKEYVCKVVGEFPSSDQDITCDQPVTLFKTKLGYSAACRSVEGFSLKEAYTTFCRINTDGETSIVLCKPKIGGSQQIRVHLQYLGYPIINDPMYNNPLWGPERFQSGPSTRNVHEISEEILRTLQYHIDPDPSSPNEDAISTSEIATDITSNQLSSDTNKVVLDINAQHVSSGEGVEAHIDSENQLLDKTSENHDSTKTSHKDSYLCPDCEGCKNSLSEPQKQWMVMYLHAYRYKGQDWEFTAPMPEWASEPTARV